MPAETLRIATWLAEQRGFSIMPIDHPAETIATDPRDIGKLPLEKWTALQRTPATSHQRHQWFGNGHQRNIGIITGAVSGVVVIDCDSPEAVAWADAHLLPTPMATRTARGEHRYYRHPGVRVRNKSRIKTGDPAVKLDARGDGGFVVGPGSVHASGVVYERLGPWPAVAELPVFDPRWLATERVETPAAPVIARRPAAQPDDHAHVLERARRYLAAIPGAVQGQGGDTHTLTAACRVVRGFDLEDADALEVLREWNGRCTPPWSDADLIKKIRNARQYGTEPMGGLRDTPRRETAPIRAARMSAQRTERPEAPGAAPEPETPVVTVADRLTEAGAAERFVRSHGDDVRFDHRRGRWLLWQGHRWAPDTDAAMTRLALAFARDWQREAVEITDQDRRSATLKAVIRLERREALRSLLALAADLQPIADAGDGWDTEPWLLGVPDGVVDLRTGEARPGQRADRLTMATAAPFDPRAVSALWEDTLAAIVPDEEARAFLQVAAGYSVTGDTRRDVWFLTQGPGRNGKGTFLHPIRRALGDYATELPAAVFDARQTGKAYDMARLPGTRFVIASEAGDTIRLHHDRIKQLTGGDAIVAEQKYERSFEFSPTCKLWLAANRKPRVTDDSPAFWARVMLVPFPVSFLGRENRDLRPALEHDADHQAAILAWLVEGAVQYARDGLTPPGTVQRATDAYEQESDPLAEFLAHACDRVPGAVMRAGDLFEHYRTWATEQGLTDRERLTSTAFGRRMGDRFEGGSDKRGKYYCGIARRVS